MKKISSIKLTWIMVLAFISLSLLISSVSRAAEEPKTSYKYIIIYGTGDLKVGDVIEVYDPEGTLCGKWVVEREGIYGQMAVFGDDPTTEDVDEGAREGELLTIRVNGEEVYPVNGKPIFEQEGETRRVDL